MKEQNAPPEVPDAVCSRKPGVRNSSITPQIDSLKERLSLLGNIKVRNLNEPLKDPPKKTEVQDILFASGESKLLAEVETSSSDSSGSESSPDRNDGFRGFATTNGLIECELSSECSSAGRTESSNESEEDENDGNGIGSARKKVDATVNQFLQSDEQLIDIESADIVIEDLEEHFSAEEDESQEVPVIENTSQLLEVLSVDHVEKDHKAVLIYSLL